MQNVWQPMADREQGAAQTPLLDLLRGVPADARMTYEINPTHHHMIPVGRLCEEAADKIADLAAELARVTEERDRWKGNAEAAGSQADSALNQAFENGAAANRERARAEQAEAREAALREALAAENARMVCLHKFAARMLQDWPDAGADGFAIQDAAVEAGLLAAVAPKPTQPCGELCNCVDYYSDNEWKEGVTCYRKTAVMKDPLARAALAREEGGGWKSK